MPSTTPRASPRLKVIAFRVDAEEGLKLDQLRSTFPEQQWGTVMRWLFEQPAVLEVIRERLNGNGGG